MDRRNWLDLSRKLVDQYDLDYQTAAMQVALGQAALSYWGEGVLITTTYPTPFPITLSGSVLGGLVGTGIAIDPNGQITEISPTPDESTSFLCAPSDPTNPRWDLLVMQYQMVGDTPVPKPSDPIVTIDLNLHDDFLITVREGIPSATPVYPAKQTNDIILAGLRIPANATLGTQIVLDLSIRENAMQRIFELPNVIDEVPAGVVNGSNTIFVTSEPPTNAGSIKVYIDGTKLLPSEFILTGSTITLNTAPALAQSIEVWYLWTNPSSLNALTGFNDTPIDSGDHQTFTLSGLPANLENTEVFVDGIKSLISEYSIIQSVNAAKLVFNAPLAIGQIPDIWYLVNAFTVGSGPGPSPITGGENLGAGIGLFYGIAGPLLAFKSLVEGSNVTIIDNGDGTVTISSTGGGGGGSTIEAHGSFSIPIVIVPSVGIVPTSANDQAWWVTTSISSPGIVLITAPLQIAAGTVVGQRLTVFGVTNGFGSYLGISNGNGVLQNGDFSMITLQSIVWMWNGTVWQFVSNAI